MSLPRVQKTAQMPQVQFNKQLVDDTVLMRTGVWEFKFNNEQLRCVRFRFQQSDRVANTPSVQPIAQIQMLAVKKGP